MDAHGGLPHLELCCNVVEDTTGDDNLLAEVVVDPQFPEDRKSILNGNVSQMSLEKSNKHYVYI